MTLVMTKRLPRPARKRSCVVCIETVMGATPRRLGVLAADFFVGPVSRFDLGNALVVDLYSGTLESVTDIPLLGGAMRWPSRPVLGSGNCPSRGG
ncbi:MAG: hypothetical protein A2092_02555 [Rhodobacteraceae bacterium GWE1_64_9]|nr:MAG: hypothetical protein A2092_02555 [Rhodobacteraceae bacterium GWE1_64_9]OHC49111.1 MAG: hypothetical protein A2X69_11375 [Rhodobacteraceae bacterium GWF1_65_7]